MSAEKKKQMGVLGLIICLLVTLIGSLLFVGAVSGWFDEPKVIIGEEYHVDAPELKDINKEEYQNLIDERKTFVIFVDQNECTTADRLRGYMGDYMKEYGMMAYRMMFGEAKESSLHEFVKYYPSVAIVDKGVVKYYLRADSDEDVEMYNGYDAFKGWMDSHLQY